MGLVAKPKYSNDSVSIDFDPSSLYDDVTNEGNHEIVYTTTYKCTCVCHHKLTIISLSIVLTVIITYFIFKDHACNQLDANIDEVLVQSFKSTTSHGMVFRNEWSAKLPNKTNDKRKKIYTPLSCVVIGDIDVENCNSFDSCASRIQSIQTAQMDQESPDIDYNFLVGGDGNWYEGCGWGFQSSLCLTKCYNGIIIGFIGNFSIIEPPEIQLNAAKSIIEFGLRINLINENYKLYVQRQFGGSQTTGMALHKIISNWPNWKN